MKHRLTFTTEELIALRDRLIPITPSNYDLQTYAILRNLYGRIDSLLLRLPWTDFLTKPSPNHPKKGG